MTLRFVTSGILGALFALAITSSALAQPAASSDREQERTRLFQEAQELGNRGDWKTASERLQRVVAIRSAPKALMALAYAEIQLGHLLRARGLYEQARDEARTASLADDVQAAEDGLRQLSPLVPRVALQLPADVASVSVQVDGALATLKNGKLEVDPGKHDLEVTADGREPFRTSFTAAQSGEIGIPITFAERTPVAPAPVAAPASDDKVPEAERSGSTFPLGPVVLAGAGAIVTGVGVVFWLGGNSDYNAIVDEECGGDASGCPREKEEELTKREDDARADILLGQISVGVGVAALAGAGVWLLTTSGSGGSEQAMNVGFAAGPRGFRATLGGRF